MSSQRPRPRRDPPGCELDDLAHIVRRARTGFFTQAQKLLRPPTHLVGLDQLVYCLAHASKEPVSLLGRAALQAFLDQRRRALSPHPRNLDHQCRVIAQALGGCGVLIVDSGTVRDVPGNEPVVVLHRIRGGAQWAMVLAEDGGCHLSRHEATACASYIAAHHGPEKKRG